MVLLLIAGVASRCTDDSEADAASPLVDMLLRDEAVLGVFPELSAHTDYSTGENHGRVNRAEVVGGPAEEATGGVVRQWSTEWSRHGDESVHPTIVRVTSMILQLPSADAAEAAADDLLDSVEREGGEPVAHETFDAMVTPPDDHVVTAVGAVAVDERVVSVQVDGVERIDRTSLDTLLDAAAERAR